MPQISYEAVIGLEVHCQLQTASKAFSPESAAFGAGPNQHIDPVSLGHPGTLPVLNPAVVQSTILMGLATHCQIARRSIFARKHYFYPDLPKGYQISQFEEPICEAGYVDVETADGNVTRVGLTRIHMEEDAGKSVHDQDPFQTLLDYNRCGVPLIEIVSEPDIRTPAEAAAYLQKIRQIVRYLGICDGNMEEGSLRCDANISIRPAGETTLGTKTEVKNMNSFRNVERAIAYEIGRQKRCMKEGIPIVQETLLWDADKEETRSMRSKELAHDYRYFPDPDLVPIVTTEEEVASLRATLPAMPEARRDRYEAEMHLPAYDATLLTEERGISDYFDSSLEALMRAGTSATLPDAAKMLSNFIMTDVMRVLNESGIAIDDLAIKPDRLAGLAALRLGNTISSSAAQQLFDLMLEQTESAAKLAEMHNLVQVSDEATLLPVVKEVLERHPKQLSEFVGGKQGLIGFFIGQVMRTYDGSPDPKLVRELILTEIESQHS